MSWLSGALRGLGGTVLGKMNPLSAVLTGISALQGISAANSANRNANRLMGQGMNAYNDAMQTSLGMNDEAASVVRDMMGIAREADRSGAFSADRRSGVLRDVMGNQLANSADAIASASRLMGYKPGDSVPIQNLRSQAGNYANRFAMMDDQFRMEEPMRRMALYQAFPGLLSSLGGQRMNIATGNLNALGGLSEAERQRGASALGGVLGSLMPLLEPAQTQPMPRPTPKFDPMKGKSALRGVARKGK